MYRRPLRPSSTNADDASNTAEMDRDVRLPSKFVNWIINRMAPSTKVAPPALREFS